MNNVFVSYEVASELKELGFDEPCLGTWNFRTKDFYYNGQPSKFSSEDVIRLPLYQQVFTWFREKYKLPSWVYTSDNEKFYYGILRDTRFLIDGNKPYETYEKAELACLLKLIEVVKNK
jgi:uncharacterized protein (DUF2461 family)